ncbi:MAG: hypothetical protein HY505_02915 [Candidatus Yanofskybacteria bacterium]|nr:hypothetical protein [Candidatus Yanofskybacteria bacterium]
MAQAARVCLISALNPTEFLDRLKHGQETTPRPLCSRHTIVWFGQMLGFALNLAKRVSPLFVYLLEEEWVTKLNTHDVVRV